MRKRTASTRARQRGGGRGDARTMPCWLWTALLLATGATAWRPPAQPLLVTPRTRRHASLAAVRHVDLLGWHLELQENRAIRSPYYTQCQFYKGHILYEDDSAATVTECESQLYGLLQVGDEEFVLQPTHTEHHILRRRDVVLSESPTAYNLTGDTVTDLDLDFENDDDLPVVPHVQPRNSERLDTDYFRSSRTVTRPVAGAKGLWLEMAIVADHTMMKFHGRERVKHYILALMNIVSAIFNDPSLNSNMTLVINKLFLYEEKDSVIKYGNVKKSLEAVNKWNYRHLTRLPPDSTGWDATVWLTRSQLGGPSGFAPVGGVCSRLRSAAIDRDEGLTSAFVIAHELGHLLGLVHDGEGQCEREGQLGSVMAPTVLATLHSYSWSTCSKQLFHEQSTKWWCLHERSNDEGVELGGAKEISNYVFTMDEQCRDEFGEGFSVCKSVKVRSACSRLWCAHRSLPHVCRSKRAPPLEGTPCGSNRWCVDRVCELMPGQKESSTPSLGGQQSNSKPEWREWGPWSSCSAACDYGLRTRKRKCRFEGKLSESACEGAGTQVATCWASEVCAAMRDPRADACSRQDRRLIPYLHANETEHCNIWCVEFTGGDPTNFGSLPDGTSCSYDRPFDVCFQGTCVKGQCNASDPSCNWCPDGYCNNNTNSYTRQLVQGWTRMTMIPHEAHQLSIHIETPIRLHIATRERKRDRPILELNKHSKCRETAQNKYLKYEPNVPQNLQIVDVDSNVLDVKEDVCEGEVVSAGSLLRWTQTDSDVFISAISRLQTDLLIMAIPAHPTEELVSVEVAVNYSTPATSRPLEYRWSVERGPCSVSCGGGVRVLRPQCARDGQCSPATYEACNTHSCGFTWAPAEWEECSASCGDAGVQERQVFCVPANVTLSSRLELIKYSVSPVLCTSTKPDKSQPCNRIPCPIYWREMPWTPCSTTCGRGFSQRPLVCPSENEMLCGQKPRERRRRCRLRKCPSKPYHCDKETTRYCELFDDDLLKRNCMIPSFRKYCCNACRIIDHFNKK